MLLSTRFFVLFNTAILAWRLSTFSLESSDASFDCYIVACGKQRRFSSPSDIQVHIMHPTLSPAIMVVGNILTGDHHVMCLFLYVCQTLI